MSTYSYAAQRRSAFPSLPFHAESFAARAAFQRYGDELARLRSLTFADSPSGGTLDWTEAKPLPPLWAQRIVLLWQDDHLQAALFYRERTVFGIGTGLLRGGDTLGETLLLCAPSQRDAMLRAAIGLLLSRRRNFLLLLDRERPGGALEHGGLPASRLQIRSLGVTVHWRHRLRDSFDESIAPFGRRTRRNLRHALRLVKQKGWQCEPELSFDELTKATAYLAERSTHPVSEVAYAARLKMSATLPGFFSMGLRNARGEWLSTLTGRRQPGGVTDILWQHNARGVDDSLCIVLRGLLMEEEVRRGGTMLRYLGGTNPLMEHCCNPETSTQVSVARPGLRFRLLQWLARTSLLSAEHPLRQHIG